MQMRLKVAHDNLRSIVTNMNCINMHSVLGLLRLFSSVCVFEWSSAPGPSSLMSLCRIYLFSNCDLDRPYFFAPQPPELYLSRIRHSRMGEFDSVTLQTCSHYLSAEYSLNVNVFLGRLHQFEILKNNPLIGKMNHQAHVPSLWCTSFTIAMVIFNGPAYKQSPARMSSTYDAGFVIRWGLGENWNICYWGVTEKQLHGLYLLTAAEMHRKSARKKTTTKSRFSVGDNYYSVNRLPMMSLFICSSEISPKVYPLS